MPYKDRQKQLAAQRRCHMQATYGITPEEYDALLRLQNGVCKICGRTAGKRRLSVDHDHATGVVRGLLCNPCNVALGLLDENPETLRSAIRYLGA
jgi:hypothetical protein